MAYEIKYRSEDEMKDSGIEWLGKVPRDWEVERIKYNSQFLNGYAFNSDNYIENGIPIIRIGDIKDKLPLGKTKKVKEDKLYKSYTVKKNDILIALTGATIGKSMIFEYNWITYLNQRVGIFRAKSIEKKLLFYFIKSDMLTEFIKLKCVGSAQENISNSDIAEFKISKGSYFDQQKIANFLDIKTSEFDSIISKKEQLIEKLEEAKKSLISEVVTGKVKIVDGELVERKPEEMKDSGVEWLGMIPKDWEIKPTKTVFFQNKIKNKRGLVNNVLSLSYGNIIKRDIESNFGLLPASFDNYQIVREGYLIFRLTDLQNDKKSLRVGLVKEVGIITSAYLGLIAKMKISTVYMYYLFHSYDLYKVYYNMGGGLRQSMTFEDIKNLLIIVPSYEEQQYLTKFIDNKIRIFNSIIAKTQKQITKLKEAKQSLISEAVTGKIDLRDWEIIESGGR